MKRPGRYAIEIAGPMRDASCMFFVGVSVLFFVVQVFFSCTVRVNRASMFFFFVPYGL